MTARKSAPRTSCVVGLQWGDEGKGKIVDILSKGKDYVVRFQGGANAGHTVVVGKETFILHLIPSGALQAGTRCVIGNGLVLDPEAMLEEWDELKQRGISLEGKILVSERAHLVMPYHKQQDGLAESGSGQKIGTTQRGIGPCYADKVARKGIRVVDLLRPAVFRKKLQECVAEKRKIFRALYGKNARIDAAAIEKQYGKFARRLKPLVVDAMDLLNREIDAGRKVLFEGAQGSLLNIDFGTYPYVTSSHSDATGISAGSGVPPSKIVRVVGIAKAYTTRVGLGPFPTELENAQGRFMREQGGEYGATTGRPRRCGWFDGVATRYSARLNGATDIVVTKLDVLSGLDEIQFCTGYKVGGKVLDRVPPDVETFSRCRPVLRSFKGWKEDLTGVRQYKDLPAAARTYLKFMEGYLGVNISMVSVGTDRRMIIRRGEGKSL